MMYSEQARNGEIEANEIKRNVIPLPEEYLNAKVYAQERYEHTVLAQTLSQKYEPKTLDEFEGNITVVKSIMENIEDSYNSDILLPHIFLDGPPGIGKTTLAKLIAVKLLNLENTDQLKNHQGFKIINASGEEERKLSAIRTEILDFINLPIVNTSRKVIILDEMDNTNFNFQHGLRVPMQEEAQNVIIIGTSNYSLRIIDPIIDRGDYYYLQPLSEHNIKSFMKKIADGENLNLSEETVEALCILCNGSARKLTMYMSRFLKFRGNAEAIEPSAIGEYVSMDTVRNMINFSLEGKLIKSIEVYETIRLAARDTVIIRQVYTIFKNSKKHPNILLAKILSDLAVLESNIRHTDGLVLFPGFLSDMYLNRLRFGRKGSKSGKRSKKQAKSGKRSKKRKS